ncbi:hypothetical protein Micbo1qcDRAFT_217890 [Microdochium bolleyi]|uniref:CFEM domain-containing protein n=1 Tax=Microdochium bolleyi TaxID=196109 RepID=A0A136JG02_9PEZI|nr:hypothetical protein Micbo1qcDRAFT_217890 [Microdochium bolleyi]
MHFSGLVLLGLPLAALAKPCRPPTSSGAVDYPTSTGSTSSVSGSLTSSTSSTTNSTATPTATPLSCPEDDSKDFTAASGSTFLVQCNVGVTGTELNARAAAEARRISARALGTSSTFNACIQLCDDLLACEAAAWNPGSAVCRGFTDASTTNNPNGEWVATIISRVSPSSSSTTVFSATSTSFSSSSSSSSSASVSASVTSSTTSAASVSVTSSTESATSTSSTSTTSSATSTTSSAPAATFTGVSNLDECAQVCYSSVIGDAEVLGCGQDPSPACLCSKQGFIDGITQCSYGSCGAGGVAFADASIALLNSNCAAANPVVTPTPAPVGLENVPACGRKCINSMFANSLVAPISCATPDASCFCLSADFFNGVRDCSVPSCGGPNADSDAAIAFANSYCFVALQ